VTGVAAGVAVISATTESGATGSVSVAVAGTVPGAPAITGITPDLVESQPGGLEVVIRGTNFVPTSGAFLNSSSRPTEYVSATELRMILWPGDLSTSATREVRVFNPGAGGGMSAGVPFVIVPGVWSVRIDPASVELWPGQEQQVTATALDEQNRPVTGRPVTWHSTNPAVATVDAAGRIRAVTAGEAQVEATIGERRTVVGVQVLAPLPWDLLYEGNHGGHSELWVLTPGPDAAPRRVLPSGTYGADPAASPDGSRIAFVGLDDFGSRNIFVANRNGSGLQQLTFNMEMDDQPAWSRDGTRIAFRSIRAGVSDIFVMNTDGTDQRNLTNNAARGMSGQIGAERPTWTPDGRVVFSFGYVLLSPQQFRLVSVKADGTDWEELTSGTEFSDYEPEVSPNGQRIAVRRASPQYGAFIDIIASDGSQLGWINLPPAGSTPSWAPDGLSLIYSLSAGPGQSAIYMYGLNGWNHRTLVPSGGRNAVFIPRS
jgi:hypothetical protein